MKGSSRDHHNICIVGVRVEETAEVVSNFSLSLRGPLKLQSAKVVEEGPHPRRHRYQTGTQTW